MGWFKRLKTGIQTATKFKKEAPDGLWFKCKDCNETSTKKELVENLHKCPNCNYHVRIGSKDYFSLIFDGVYTEMFSDIISKDVLEFSDIKPYTERLQSALVKTELTDAITVAVGKVSKRPLVIAEWILALLVVLWAL